MRADGHAPGRPTPDGRDPGQVPGRDSRQDYGSLPMLRRVRRLTAAVADHGLAAAGALRALLRDRGPRRALSGPARSMAELGLVRVLLDEGPESGGTGRTLMAGRAPSAGPPHRIRAPHPGHRARGDGAAEAVELVDQEKQFIATAGSFLGFLRNIEVLSAGGRILVQNVRGPDGIVRYVVQAPGIAPGRPRNDSPQYLAGTRPGADRAADSPYIRSVLLALEDYGIPRGADLALIGHREGGLAMLNLAQDEEFCRTYRVTHVVAVGSRGGHGRPADPRTWIAGITNQYDVLPGQDGQDAASACEPHPNRYDVDYAGPTRAVPLCQMLREYIEHLRTVVPGAREAVDTALTPYRGPIVRTQAYRLKDRARPPEGYPFLTLPTGSIATTVGPVDVPVRYSDSSAAHLCFPVCADTARGLLPDVPWLTPSRLGGRALAVLSLHEHRRTTIGPYTEIALSVLVDDLWRPGPYDLAADLLRRADLRRTGRHVLSVAVTSEEARVVAREIWGQPAMRTTAEADLTGREIDVRSRDLGLTVRGPLGPGIRCPEADWVLYGRRGESTVRTLVRARGRLRLHPGTGVRLRLGTAAAEPLAGQLRRLGIDAARPLFVLACPRFMLHRSAGAVLPR
ncbi:hypothetical protein AQI95_03715 [Streptomyces yokosukanensis]|uniref:Acetoacetate decarboxylase n=1 Tax=Streptomyces yokosukanensis TaxID=67386 RepID=A0A101PDR1_9ACTN|nr:acetoacetate decarboxylase family protein [Streptomyces yokosukanensis]KUN09682.1 hypothetical protein AQI95_03715 [Streptomyces yokosukanensis]